jgi:hypothetical protein
MEQRIEKPESSKAQQSADESKPGHEQLFAGSTDKEALDAWANQFVESLKSDGFASVGKSWETSASDSKRTHPSLPNVELLDGNTVITNSLTTDTQIPAGKSPTDITTKKDSVTGFDTTRNFDVQGRLIGEHWRDDVGFSHDNTWNPDNGTTVQRKTHTDGSFREHHQGPKPEDNYDVIGHPDGDRVAMWDLGGNNWKEKYTFELSPEENHTRTHTEQGPGKYKNEYVYDNNHAKDFKREFDGTGQYDKETITTANGKVEVRESTRAGDPIERDPESGLAMEFRFGTSEEFKQQMREEVARIPESHRRALNEAGTHFVFAQKMTDYNAGAADTRPAGFKPGHTAADTDGTYFSVPRDIVVTETVNGVPVSADNHSDVFWHETGHALDHALGKRTGTQWVHDTPAAHQAYSDDLSNMARAEVPIMTRRQFGHEQAVNNYLLQGADSKGIREAFGEAYGAKYGHASRHSFWGNAPRAQQAESVTSLFNKTTRYFSDRLDELEKR